MPTGQASKRLQVQLFGSADSTALEMFDYLHAKCYDPNEQAKLQGIIGAVGGEIFNFRIRELAKNLKNRRTSEVDEDRSFRSSEADRSLD